MYWHILALDYCYIVLLKIFFAILIIYNNIISTGITLLGGYGVDLLMKNKTRKFIEKFKQLNAADPKVLKYVEGINILRPTIIFAAIYYGILPMFSTYLSEKIDKHTK